MCLSKPYSQWTSLLGEEAALSWTPRATVAVGSKKVAPAVHAPCPAFRQPVPCRAANAIHRSGHANVSRAKKGDLIYRLIRRVGEVACIPCSMARHSGPSYGVLTTQLLPLHNVIPRRASSCAPLCEYLKYTTPTFPRSLQENLAPAALYIACRRIRRQHGAVTRHQTRRLQSVLLRVLRLHCRISVWLCELYSIAADDEWNG